MAGNRGIGAVPDVPEVLGKPVGQSPAGLPDVKSTTGEALDTVYQVFRGAGEMVVDIEGVVAGSGDGSAVGEEGASVATGAGSWEGTRKRAWGGCGAADQIVS